RYEGADGAAPPQQPASAPASPPRYLLASHVAPNWIPLLPVQLQSTVGGLFQSRLRRGAVLQPDGSQARHPAQGDLFNAKPELSLVDEEVPREGVHITRQRRMARWIDGSYWVWTALQAEIGRGEGSAGLRFDRLEGDASNGSSTG